MPTRMSGEQRQNSKALRAVYGRPAIKKTVRLFQSMFDEGYWVREKALAREAEKLEDELYLACRKIASEARIGGLYMQNPRVALVFESHATIALRQLLGITRDDLRLTGALIWFKWLVRNWNVDKDAVPKLPKKIRAVEPQLSSYAIYTMPLPELSSDQETGKPWHLNSWVMAQVFPGVSHRDLQECMGQLYSQVNALSNGKGVRPSKGGAPPRLADWEWEDVFLQFGRIVNGISPRIPKIQEYIKKQYGEHYSASQIRARYEEFLNTHPQYLSVR